MKLTHHLGADFVDVTGTRIRCFQLLRDGEAVAIADFENAKLVRFACVQSVTNDALVWLVHRKQEVITP